MKNVTHNFKLLFLTYALLLGGIITTFAQTKGIPYQAYITTNVDVPGEEVVVPLTNTEILLEFIVRDENGDEEYREHILVTTDKYGLASTVVGAGYGTPQNGTDFEDIDWNGLSKILDIGIDFTNAGDFSDHSEMPIIYIPGPTATTTTGTSSGTGAPTATNPANPQAGDIYVDESTGDVYTYDGSTWTSQSDIVSADTDNVITEDADGLAYLDASLIENAAGTSSGSGAPTATNPANPQAGDIYVDESTGDVYTYDGSTWTSQSDIVSADTDNVITEDADGLAYLDASLIENAAGTSSGSGAPTATNPANPQAGDIYVDESTGDVYTYDGSTWTSQSDIVSADTDNVITEDADGLAYLDASLIENAAGTSSGSGAPTATNPANPQAGDIYVDESTGDVYTYDGSTWTSQSDIVSADTDNVITEDADGLAYLDASLIENAAGTSSGSGAPTATNPANPQAGDIYVDESTGDVYTYDGSTWTSQSDIVSADTDNVITEDADGLAYLDASLIENAAGTSSGSGAPTATNPANPQAGDIYVDESTGDVYTYDGSTWTSQSDIVSADTDNVITEDADGLAYLDASLIENAAGTSSGSGAPTATNPANPQAGDIYVDESTGDVYTYDGSTWTSQSDIVSADTDNVITEDADGLAYLDASLIENAAGTSSGSGAPTATNPANPQAGDIYVDESTGDVYTYDGSTWTSQSDIVSADTDNVITEDADGLAYLDASLIENAAGTSSGTGAPTATNPANPQAGDIYVDESTGDVYTYDGSTWTSQSDIVSADTDNVITEDADGLAYLDASLIENAAGTSSGSGAPTATNPANPQAGDIYVDESTGDVYTYDGSTWTSQSDIVSADTDNVITEDADGLAYLDASLIENAAGTSSGSGAPTATNPANPQAGDIYVDESTGDVYTYDGSTWTSQSDIVSADTDNVITEDADGLAYLDASLIENAAGTSSGSGAPTATNPANPQAGDIYVDESTGDVYTYDGSTWTNQSDEILTMLSVQSNAGPDGVSGNADDFDELIYEDEEGTANTVDISSLIKAENGLSVASGTIVLGGTLIQPTTITTDATNTLAVDGLEAPADTDDYDVVTVDNTSGVLKKTPISSLGIRRYVQAYTAADGDIQFAVPQAITDATDLDNIDVYRNGVRIDFTQVDANTVQLNLGALTGCYAGDEIRIVQLQ